MSKPKQTNKIAEMDLETSLIAWEDFARIRNMYSSYSKEEEQHWYLTPKDRESILHKLVEYFREGKLIIKEDLWNGQNS